MQSLANIFNQHKRSPIIKKVQASLLVEKANDIIKGLLRDRGDLAQAAYVKDSTLAIACLSSVVSQELKLQEAKLLGELNKWQNGEKITAVKFLL